MNQDQSSSSSSIQQPHAATNIPESSQTVEEELWDLSQEELDKREAAAQADAEAYDLELAARMKRAEQIAKVKMYEEKQKKRGADFYPLALYQEQQPHFNPPAQSPSTASGGSTQGLAPAGDRKATHLLDYDGKSYYTYNTSSAVSSIPSSTPFRRLCDPSRLHEYCGMDMLSFEPSDILEVIKAYSRSFSICSSSTQTLPGHQMWKSTNRFAELESLQVFQLEYFNLFCRFRFQQPTSKGLSLTLRSFLPLEQRSLPWTGDRVIAAVLNFQTVLAIVFGPPWFGVFSQAVDALQSGSIITPDTRPAPYLVFALDNQLYRVGQTLAARWAPESAEHYQVASLGDVDGVRQVLQRMLLAELDFSSSTYLHWRLEVEPLTAHVRKQHDQDKPTAPLPTLSPTTGPSPSPSKRPANRPSPRSRKAKKALANPPETVKHSPSRHPNKKTRFNLDAKSDSSSEGAVLQPRFRKKLCYNTLCKALKVEGHGHTECHTDGCEYEHAFVASRKQDYVRIVQSPTFQASEACKKACKKAAEALP
jgi:hypothetical protein